MLLYRLECRKNTEKPKIRNDKKWKNSCFYQNVKSVIVKNQNLAKGKKLANYEAVQV